MRTSWSPTSTEGVAPDGRVNHPKPSWSLGARLAVPALITGLLLTASPASAGPPTTGTLECFWRPGVMTATLHGNTLTATDGTIIIKSPTTRMDEVGRRGVSWGTCSLNGGPEFPAFESRFARGLG